MYADSAPKNLLLSNLSPASFEVLSPALEYVEMPTGQIVVEEGEIIPYAYFPDTSVLSIIASSKEGQSVAIGTIGREGCSGINLGLGVDRADRRRIVQMSGFGWKLEGRHFKTALSKNEELRSLMCRFTLVLLHQTAQAAFCNRLHKIPERCAQWLLLTYDRRQDKRVGLIQEIIATMLGVRRAGVNDALSLLRRAGAVRVSRGQITITDRDGLERTSCSCYKEISDFYFKTMGFSMSFDPRSGNDVAQTTPFLEYPESPGL